MPSRDKAPSFLLLPELAAAGTAVALPEDERHYLIHVCRARTGDRATATDGRGRVASVRLVEAGKTARVEIERVEERRREAIAWVMCGAPEGGRADWLVEKLAELGVAVFQPLDTDRARWPVAGSRSARLERIAVAALRQSRRAHLLEVRPARRLDEALAALPEGAERWLCSATATDRPPHPDAAAGGLTAVSVVGPAEGLTGDEEASLVGRGFRAMLLSDARLRTETAAVAWASWWAGRVVSDARGGVA